MADHLQPEWRQNADRRSTLVDPVITVRQLARFGFSRRAHSHIDHALVFTTAEGTYREYLPPSRPTRREAAARRFTAVYEIDMGVHRARALMKLPSNNDALQFDAELHLTWRVSNPGCFVRQGHRNVPHLLLDEIQGVLRPESRRFAITDSAEAEAELQTTLRKHGPIGLGAGLNSDFSLLLHRDRENIEHEKRLQTISHASVEDMEKAKSEIKLQQWDRQKIDFYQQYLEQGGVTPWAFQLMKHPENLTDVMDKLQAHRLDHLQKQFELATRLLDEGEVENHELEEPLRYAITFMQSLLKGGLLSSPEQAPLAGPSLPSVESVPADQHSAEKTL